MQSAPRRTPTAVTKKSKHLLLTSVAEICKANFPANALALSKFGSVDQRSLLIGEIPMFNAIDLDQRQAFCMPALGEGAAVDRWSHV